MMQLKRILVSLLVAVMMISMAVLAVSAAETENNTFVVAVDAVDNRGNLTVTPGETVDVSIIVTNNPGVCYATVLVTYDADALECVDQDFTSGDIYTVKLVQSVAGRTVIITDINSTKDVAVAGTLVTLTFKVKDTYTGEKAQILIDSVEARNAKNAVIDAVGFNGFADCTHATVKVEAGFDATCTEDGLTDANVCTVCGAIVSGGEVIPAIGHTEEIVAGKAATCTETGLTDANVCTVCGAIVSGGEVIPATGHTEEIVAGKAATCTETGLTEGKKCSVCGETTVAQEEIPATGHTEEIVAGKAATCTETGLTEGKKCSVCGETTVAQEEIPATGHTEEVIPAVAATCTETGLTEGKKCSVCGETTVAQETIAALGHTWTDATCTDAKTCSVCNATEGEANGHTYTNDCDADCDVCGETRTPAAHAYGEWKVVTEATKKAEGKQEKTCSVCGNVESEVIPMVKGGCNSVMGALAVVAMTMVGAAVVIRKKED